jgi:hypothetical protein
MNRKLTTKLAMTALAASLAAPAFAQDQGHHWWQPTWLTRWAPPSNMPLNVMNGNDFRDNRDSTLSRNDVPMNQTTLQSAAPSRLEPWTDHRTVEQRWESSEAPAASSMNQPHTSYVAPATAALPATAVQEAPAPVVVEGPPAAPVNELAQDQQTTITTTTTTVAPMNGNDVTARNTNGVQAVHDSERRDVTPGVEGAGGTDALSAGRSSESAQGQ